MPTIYTIGHSNQPLDEFLRLLLLHRLEVLVDVRSAPYSKYTTQFNSAPLKTSVTAAGCKYLYLGDELGGRPKGAAFYDAEGHVRYDRVAESPLFLAGITRVETGIARYRVALLCSEEDPTGCHRRLLVGRVLTGRGTTVCHIRGDGRLQAEAELAAAEAAAAPQATLFALEDVTPWRSIRSVLPKNGRPSSSDS
ncbi:MAG: DUF488 domain-containing protein [Chloroflexota bacterium]|nr:DUF488 domain-containing protein [Chloroflexota bacterium]